MKRWLLLVFLFLLSSIIEINAQANFRTRCPYDLNNWPYPSSDDWLGCPPATFTDRNGALCPSNYRIKPHQDCCGALPLCSLVSDVNSVGSGPVTGFNASICGQGCDAEEINPNATCIGFTERQTSWYLFEVRPLPGRPYVKGDYAGKLRFKVFPCDVPPNPSTCDQTASSVACVCENVDPTNPIYCADNGLTDIGTVDYDWVVFRIDNYRTRRAACTAIKQSNAAVVCCNQTEVPGPTGMFEFPDGSPQSCNIPPGRNPGQRFTEPPVVHVGERFMLALDGWTASNRKGYKIDFRGTCANEQRDGPTADISPIPPGFHLDTIVEDSNYCANGGIVFKFSDVVRNEAIEPKDFKLFYFDNATGAVDSSFQISDVLPIDNPLTATQFRLNFLPGKIGRYALRYKDTIPDICGDRYVNDTLFFRVNDYFTKNHTENLRCALPSNFDTLSISLKPWFGFPTTNPESNDTTIGIYDWQVLKLTKSSPQNAVEADWITIDRPGKVSEIPNAPAFGNLSVSSPKFRQGTSLANWKKVSTIYVSDSLLEGPGISGIQTRYFRIKHRFPLGDIVNPISTGCQNDSIFKVRFYPLPNANIVNADTTCYGEGPGRLAIIEPDTINKRYVWYQVSSNTSQTLGDSVGVGVTLKPVTVPDEIAYYRVYVYDSISKCENIVPNFGVPAVSIRNAVQVVPIIETQILNEGVATFPAQIAFKNRSKRRIGNNLTDLPTTGITYVWTWVDPITQQVTTETTDDINKEFVRSYTETPSGKDTVLVPVALRAYDDLSLKVNANTCILDTSAIVVLRVPTFPNVITPGDGNPANDNLRFLADGGEYQLEVFNRYGNIVYENADYKNDWNASNVPSGMYYYLVTNKKTQGKFKGWVQVIK